MENKPTIAIPQQGCESYLTAGKEYEIIDSNRNGFRIFDDTGFAISCSFKESAHLNGKDWILK